MGPGEGIVRAGKQDHPGKSPLPPTLYTSYSRTPPQKDTWPCCMDDFYLMVYKHIFHLERENLFHIFDTCMVRLLPHISHQYSLHFFRIAGLDYSYRGGSHRSPQYKLDGQGTPYCCRNKVLREVQAPQDADKLSSRKCSSPRFLTESMHKMKGHKWRKKLLHSHRSRDPRRRECNPQENWHQDSKGRLLERIHGQCMSAHRHKELSHKYRLLHPQQ